MIQFNLLPDVKLEFIKAGRLKRSVMTIATIAGATALAVMVLLFVAVNVVQKQYLDDLSGDIKSTSNKLSSTPDLDKILTIQNQLSSLNSLHDGKKSTLRIKDFLAQLTPANTTFAEVKVSYVDNTIKFTGAADSLKTTNQFVDTLKFTKYKLPDSDQSSAFSEVVLTAFGRDDKGAKFEINLKFNPDIFDITKQITLNVPNIVTTRSVTEKPGDLFKPLSDTKVGQ